MDPLTGEDKEIPVNLGSNFSQKGIVDGKIFENNIVFRDTFNQFYCIDKLTNP
jgi:hypothetical protein